MKPSTFNFLLLLFIFSLTNIEGFAMPNHPQTLPPIAKNVKTAKNNYNAKGKFKRVFKDVVGILFLTGINWFLFTAAFALFKIGVWWSIGLGGLIIMAFIGACILIASLSNGGLRGYRNDKKKYLFVIKFLLMGVLAWLAIMGLLWLFKIPIFLFGIKVI